jgi:hypothetical protein
MSDASQQHSKNKALAAYWNEKIQYWLICEEFRLKQPFLSNMETECAFDAMNSMPDYLSRLMKRLQDLGVEEDEIENPPFFCKNH